VRTLFEHTQEILEVARAGNGAETTDFALLVRPDGGLHFVMEAPFTLDAVQAEQGACAGFHVKRSAAGIRVMGRRGGETCTLETRSLLPAGPALYLVAPASSRT
jgi:hypothetical protein